MLKYLSLVLKNINPSIRIHNRNHLKLGGLAMSGFFARKPPNAMSS